MGCTDATLAPAEGGVANAGAAKAEGNRPACTKHREGSLETGPEWFIEDPCGASPPYLLIAWSLIRLICHGVN
ncbi:MAG: hypothetical protein U0X91_00555 [Spirosomataceae bacterium]